MTERFYVTIIRDASPKPRVGFLAGPYASKADAEAHVREATDKATDVDPRAWFDAFGVTMVDSAEPLRAVFGTLEK